MANVTKVFQTLSDGKEELVKVHVDCGLCGLTFSRPSKVKPQFKDECDLNLIVKRFLKDGTLPNCGSGRPEIANSLSLPDNFQDLMDANVKVRQSFDLLPQEVRNQFNNDPESWLAALDEQERKRLEEEVKKAQPDDKPPTPPTPLEPPKDEPKPSQDESKE